MSTADCSELLRETKSVLLEMKSKTFDVCSLRVDSADVSNQLQILYKTKQDLKENFYKRLTLNSFMRNLAEPKGNWNLIAAQTDAKLQATKSTLKKAEHSFEHEKQQLIELSSVVEQGMAMYEQNLKTLQEKSEIVQNLSQELKRLQEASHSHSYDDETLSQELEAELAKYAAGINECEKELQEIYHKNSQLKLLISQNENDPEPLTINLDEDEEHTEIQSLTRLQESLTDMELLSGVKITSAGGHTVVVEFPPKPSGTQPIFNRDVPYDDLVLKVTLSFQENTLGYLYLSDVKSNMESFEMEDLWKESEDRTISSLPQLMNSIKLRWFSHVPLLSEINYLRCKFAIDWIQQKNTLRVIVGKGGDVVCSLKIPSGYPCHGQVTLTDIMGAKQHTSVEDLQPQTGNRLEDWVQYLESYFGTL